jgi:glycosyltransferase involved in cell wall biosynthesis
VIGYLGRIDPRKGVHDVVRLAGKIEGQVVVVGDMASAAPDYRRQLEELAGQAPTGSVQFAGPTDDPYLALAGFDVLVVPSRAEPFGRVAAEAQRAGVPVVAAGAAGLLDIVTDGVSGLTFPPGDVEALASGVERLLKDDALRNTVVDGGRQSAERFDADCHASEMAALFTAVISNGRHPARTIFHGVEG